MVGYSSLIWLATEATKSKHHHPPNREVEAHATLALFWLGLRCAQCLRSSEAVGYLRTWRCDLHRVAHPGKAAAERRLRDSSAKEVLLPAARPACLAL